MPLIKPRTRGKAFVRLITRLEHETNETLYAYSQFLGEPVEYVLNQLIDTVLAKDKEFMAWRAEHPGSCVPRAPVSKKTKTARSTAVTRDATTISPPRSVAVGS